MKNIKEKGCEILLSICIPTYNRADILEKTMETYINDPAFDESVEIVISDNCSTDHTEKCVSKFLNKRKNIRYKKLKKNIGADLNMNTALLMGSGLYLKLMNDSALMNPGVLKYILDILRMGINEMKPTFFYQNIPFLNSNKTINCSNLDELVSNVSYWSTWIANFGAWKKDFDILEDKDRFAHLQFVQTDWTLRINKQKQCNIHFGDYYTTAKLNTKGGYNVFQTFAVNYLSLYDEYLESNLLTRATYNKEKYRLYRYFLIGWYKILVLENNNNYVFEKINADEILKGVYKNNFYYYVGLVYLFIKKRIISTK